MSTTRRNLLVAVLVGVAGVLIGKAVGLHGGGLRLLLIVVLVGVGVPLASRLPIWERPSEPAGGAERP